MGTSITPTVLLRPNSAAVYGGPTAEHPNLGVRVISRSRMLRTAAISEASAAADPAYGVATWQIVVGSLAGVTPFVVAGIEFSKRIVAQRKCGVCKGSGLVLRDNKYYFRCPNCGGFLPWQSWKRFFSG